MLSEAQIKERTGKITSSIAAGALGLTPKLMSPLKAWQAARGELPQNETKATDRGNRLEEVVLDYPADVLGLVRFDAPFRQHPSHPWAGDSADALYMDHGLGTPKFVGEGKTAAMGMAQHFGEEGTDEIPESALVQSHWHLIHWPEVERCVVPVLVGGYSFEFRLYYVDRDTEFEGVLLQDLEQWHRDYVVTGNPPPVTGSEFDRDWLLTRNPTASSLMVADTPELQHWARVKVKAAEEKKSAELCEEEAKNHLRALLGGAAGCKASWGSITYRNNEPTEKVDWQALAAECGISHEVIARFTRHVPGPRVLRVTVKE